MSVPQAGRGQTPQVSRRSPDPRLLETEPRRAPCSGPGWRPGDSGEGPGDSREGPGPGVGGWQLPSRGPGVRRGERRRVCPGSPALAPPSAGSRADSACVLAGGRRRGRGGGGEALQSQGPSPSPAPRPGAAGRTKARPRPPAGDTGDPAPGAGSVFSPRLARPAELGTLSTAQAHGHAPLSRILGVGTSGAGSTEGTRSGRGSAPPLPAGLHRRPPGGGARGEPAGERSRAAEPRGAAPDRVCSVLSYPLAPTQVPRKSRPGLRPGEGTPALRFCCRGCGWYPCLQCQGYFTSSPLVFPDSVALFGWFE